MKGSTLLLKLVPGACSSDCCGRLSAAWARSTWKTKIACRRRSIKSPRLVRTRLNVRLKRFNTERTEIRAQRAQRNPSAYMFSLRDKVALSTGASQGIGRDTALALAEPRAQVAV